jgi:hypothetical protein
VFVLVGAFIATVAQFIKDDWPEPFNFLGDWQFGIGVAGALAALLGGSLTFWLQRRNPEELRLASEALATAEKERMSALELKDELSADFKLVAERDEQRGHIAAAMLAILEAVDQILVERAALNIRNDIERVLEAGADSILDGLRLRADLYCFSVFQRTGNDAAARMQVVGERRARTFPRRRQAPRVWAKGEGFTGFAWNLGYELQIIDTSSQDWCQNCRVEAGTTEDDRRSYRSVISVPIRPGPDQGEPWGMITVTSNQAGRFGDPERGGDISADAVRAIAKALAIMVAARYFPAPPLDH